MNQGAAPDSPRVSIVVPTLNEVANIDRLLGALCALPFAPGELEILIADDQSSDGTPERVRHWAADYPVRLVQRDGPPDLAASVVAGARAARGRWVAVMDADGSHPAQMIPKLIEPLEAGRADVTVGSRHVAGGGIDDWPWWRRLASRLGARLAWPFTDIADPMSGLFATATERLAALPAERAGYKILLELLVQGTPPARVEEIPFRFRDRAGGQSKMGPAVQWMLIKRLAALGGARMDLGNLTRFGLVGLSGLAVDLAIFQALHWTGIGLAAAHMTSFLAATLTNFTLNYRWTFARTFAPGESVALRYLRFLAVALLALVLRGGVLASLVYGLGLEPAMAIFPAVVVTAVVNYLGSTFFVFPVPGVRQRVEIRWRLAALGLMAYAMALMVVYMGRVELIPDEMYYWVWTLHPALSYVDHPPLVAWLIWIGSAIFGDNPFGVRLANVVLAPLAAWFAYLYGRDMAGKTVGLLCALLVFTLPAYLSGGFLMTPDAPLIAAWAAALYYFRRALIDQDRRAFLGLGVAMGIGLLSKYTMAFLAPAALCFMLSQRAAWHWFRRPEPWLAVVLATVLFVPVLIWNWQHEWASFAFQSARRVVENPEFTSHMVLVWTVVMFAPLAGFVLFYLLGPVRAGLAPDAVQRRFMLLMTLVPLALFAAFGAFTQVKFHWIIPVWLGMLPMLAATFLPAAPGIDRPGLRRIRRLWPASVISVLILFGALAHYVTLGLPGIPWGEHRLGYMGWPEIAEAVHELETEVEARTGRRPIVAGMSKWHVAAALSFHSVDGRRDNITARNLVGMGGSQWERWFDPDTDPSRPVILVNHEPKLIDEEWLERAVIGLGPLKSRPVFRDGRQVQVLYYRIADGFRAEQVRYPDRIPE